MQKIASVNGRWMRVIARQHWPTLSRGAQVDQLARALQISRRSCYAMIREERIMQPAVQDRFIVLFGVPPAEGWREVTLKRVPADKKRNDIAPAVIPQAVAADRENWRLNLQTQARNLAQVGLNHLLGNFVQSITVGQLAQIEQNIDEEEARAAYPTDFDKLIEPDDWVVQCRACGLMGAIDEEARELNGLVFRVTCGTESYKIGS